MLNLIRKTRQKGISDWMCLFSIIWKEEEICEFIMKLHGRTKNSGHEEEAQVYVNISFPFVDGISKSK